MTKIAKTALIIAIVGVGLWWACVIGKENQQKDRYNKACNYLVFLEEEDREGISHNDRETAYLIRWMERNGVSYDGPR